MREASSVSISLAVFYAHIPELDDRDPSAFDPLCAMKLAVLRTLFCCHSVKTSNILVID